MPTLILRFRSIFFILIRFIFLGLFAATAVAATNPDKKLDIESQPVAQDTAPGLLLDATAGFDGYYKQEKWFPVIINAANQSAPITGRVQILTGSSGLNNGSVYDAPISLPTQSNKRVPLIVYPANQFSNDLPVQLVDENGNLIRQTTTNRLRSLRANDLLYGVISPEPSQFAGLESINGGRGFAGVAYLTIDDLPETAVAWQALDILLIDDSDTSQLSPAQINALSAWVETGGQLVVTGGPNWQKTTVALADLLPVTINGMVTVADLPALSNATGLPLANNSPYLVSDSSLRTGELLLHENGLPILARRDMGQGAVYFLALDPKLAPLRDWEGSAAIWAQVANNLSAPIPWQNGIQNDYAAETAVAVLPNLTIPSAGLLIIFLLFYTLIIGPINYLILKRTNRRELAWLTIPVTVLIFSAITYFVGFQIKGNTPIINQMSVVYGHIESHTGRVNSLLGLYSPQRTTYDLVLPNDAPARAMDTSYGNNNADFAALTRTNKMELREIRSNVSTVSAFIADTTRPLPALDATATLRPDASEIVLDVNIHNQSDTLLQQTSIFLGEDAFSVGDIPAGEKVNMQIPLAKPVSSALGFSRSYSGTPLSGNGEILLGTADYFDDATAYARWQLLQAIEGPTPTTFTGSTAVPSTVTLVAWTNSSQLDVSLADKDFTNQQTTLYFIDLPLTEMPIQGENISVPFNLLAWQLLDDSGLFEPSISPLYLNGGWIEYEIQPSAQFDDMDVQALGIVLQTNDTSAIEPSVFLWDWTQNKWIGLADSRWGETAVPDYGRYLNTNNQLRLRLEDNSQYGVEITAVYPNMRGNLR
ncbi:MAG: hypothetical protein KDE48_23045 [Anaerolineales bacterium]|nr:hypothetical protein [Anaerolineales bacterium]